MAEDKPAFDLAEVLNAIAKQAGIFEEIADAFAKKAAEDFAELKDKFVIYYAPADKLYGHFRNDQREALLEIGRKRNEGSSPAANAAHPLKDGNGHYVISCFIESSGMQAVLRHELGHLVAPRGYFKGRHGDNFLECVADVFSILYQQRGNADLRQQLDRLSFNTAYWLIERGDAIHFSLPVLNELKRISTTHDLPGMRLTPVQIANIAYRLSLLYAPSEDDVQKIARRFKSVKKSFKSGEKRWSIKPYKKIAGIILKNRGNVSRLTFIAGKACLEPYLNQRTDIIANWGKESFRVFDGACWDYIRQEIKERTLAAEAEPPAQRFAREARDMMVLGCFDKNPDAMIDPDDYESRENTAYRQRAMEVYAALRQHNLRIDQEQIVTRARENA